MIRIKSIAIFLLAFTAYQYKVWGQSGSWADYQKDYTGSGTTITIVNAGQLAKLAAVVNEGADLSSVTINLEGDIDLKDYNWTPIGSSYTSAFEGTFNGGGHKITGLTINNDALDNAGLFGYCNGATISNLTVNAGSISAGENVGVLAGTLISSTVTGCSVSATSISGTRNVSVLVGYRDKVSGITSCTVTSAVSVSLASRSDLTANLNKPCNVTLSGRTLYKDGAWNTICLPFDYDPAYGVLAGDDVEVYTLTDQANKAAEIIDDRLILRFRENIAGNGVMRAGVPYIIKWKNTGSNLSNPVFNGVVPRVISTDDYNNGVEGANRVRFCGTFDPISFSSSDQSILFMAEGNTLYYPNGIKTIKVGAFRAYFKIGDDSGSSQIKDFDLNFGDATDITSDFIFDEMENSSDNKWFTIDGRCIIGKPTEKGLYIHKGRKEIIK